MVSWSCWVLLLLCTAARFFGWLALSTPLEEEGQEKLQEQLDKWLWPRLKTLITSRQHQVAQLMEDITQQIGNMSSCGTPGLQEGHRVVLSDLHNMQEIAQDVYSQLGESDLVCLLAQQCQMEVVMENLQRVNQSLGLMLAAVEGARNLLENHLEQLHAVLDPAGQSPSAISTCILHGSYLVLLVALLVPTPPRAILLLLAFSILGEFLNIPALSTLLALAVAGQLLVVATRHGAGGPWLVLPQEEPHHQLTSTPDRECKIELLQEELERMEMSSLQEPLCLEQPPVMAEDTPRLGRGASPVPSSWRTKRSSCRVMLEPAISTRKHWEPKPCNPSQFLASDVSSMSPRLPCQGLTRAGQRCRKKAISGQDFCHLHTTGRTSCSGLPMDSSPQRGF